MIYDEIIEDNMEANAKKFELMENIQKEKEEKETRETAHTTDSDSWIIKPPKFEAHDPESCCELLRRCLYCHTIMLKSQYTCQQCSKGHQSEEMQQLIKALEDEAEIVLGIDIVKSRTPTAHNKARQWHENDMKQARKHWRG